MEVGLSTLQFRFQAMETLKWDSLGTCWFFGKKITYTEDHFVSTL